MIETTTFLVRFRQHMLQRRKVGKNSFEDYIETFEEVTGDVQRSHDEAFDLCHRLNRYWKGQMDHWPIEYSVVRGKAAKELHDYREDFGFTGRKR